MPCRACGFYHPPMLRCEVARRIAINNGAINSAINKSSGNFVGIEGKERDRISEPESNNQGNEGLLQRKAPAKDVKRRGCPDARTAELSGARICSQMPDGKRAVPGEENSIAVSEVTPNRRSRIDYNGYMRGYMKKRRAKSKPA